MPAPDEPVDEHARPGREDAAAERRRMRGSTAVFAAATALSRVAGLAREVLVALVFGISTTLSAFTIAWQIPNLFRALVSESALSAAFVPVFTDLREHGEQRHAWRVASTMCTIIVLFTVPLCALLIALAPQVVGLFVDQSALGADFDLAVDLTRLLLPLVVVMSLSGLVVGLLNAHDHFAVPAIAPLAWNLVVIASLAAAATMSEDVGIWVYAGGMLAGLVVQAVLPLPWLRDRGGSIRPILEWRDPRVREILVAMLPVTLALGLINVQLLLGTAFSTHVPEEWFPRGVDPGGGPAILDKAYRVYMLPQGVFSVAVTTVVFPALARHASRGDDVAFGRTVTDGMRQILVLLLPFAALLVALHEPVIRVLFQYLAFEPADTPVVGDALAGLAVGLVFNGASLLLIRGLFARRRTWLPALAASIVLVVNLVAILALYRGWGTTGIALATSLANIAQFTVLYVLLGRDAGWHGIGRTARVAAVAATLAVASAALAALLHGALQGALGGGAVGDAIALAGAGVCALAAYAAAILRLGLVDRAVVPGLRRRGGGTG